MHMLEANRDDPFTKKETLALGHLLLMYWSPRASSTAWIPQYTGLKVLSPREMFVEINWTTHRSWVRHSKGRSCWEGSSKDIKNLTYTVGSNVDEDDEVDQGFEILGKWKLLSLSTRAWQTRLGQPNPRWKPCETSWTLAPLLRANLSGPWITCPGTTCSWSEERWVTNPYSEDCKLQIAYPLSHSEQWDQSAKANCFGRRVPRALNEWDCPPSTARRPKTRSTRTWVL